MNAAQMPPTCQPTHLEVHRRRANLDPCSSRRAWARAQRHGRLASVVVADSSGIAILHQSLRAGSAPAGPPVVASQPRIKTRVSAAGRPFPMMVHSSELESVSGRGRPVLSWQGQSPALALADIARCSALPEATLEPLPLSKLRPRERGASSAARECAGGVDAHPSCRQPVRQTRCPAGAKSKGCSGGRANHLRRVRTTPSVTRSFRACLRLSTLCRKKQWWGSTRRRWP
jgi:hypothetical protein